MASSSSSPDRPFLVTAAGGGGLTPAQVRHPRFAKPSRGVRLPADMPPTPALLSEAALDVAPEHATLCDVEAARHWDLPLPPWIGLDDHRPIAVAVPRGRVRQRRRGIRGRRLELPDSHLVVVEGLPVTTPARTWVDCAELVPVPYLVAMGDAILRRRLAGERELDDMLRWARGRRGVVAARTARPLLDPRAESASESVVRCHLVQAGLPRPVCNLDIVVGGEWIARADLAWPAQRVIVEYDGMTHLDEVRRRSDAARRNLLQDRGWLVIVLTARDLARPHEFVALVRSALDSRTPR